MKERSTLARSKLKTPTFPVILEDVKPMKILILIVAAFAILGHLYWARTQVVEQQSRVHARIQNRIKADLNLRFDDLERAYWATPLDLRGKNVLVVSYGGLGVCGDVCRHLVNGNSGAEVFFAIFKFPDQPDFTSPVDLAALAQGRILPNASNEFAPFFEGMAEGEHRPELDYVVIEMRSAINTVLSAALTEFDLEPAWGTADVVLSPVPDGRSFQLDHAQAHFIWFHRSSEIMGRNIGWTHVFDGSRINQRVARTALEQMLCAKSAPPHDVCIDDN